MDRDVELEVAVKVLRDCQSSMSKDLARLREASAYLEQRVRTLEQGRAGAAARPPPEPPMAALKDPEADAEMAAEKPEEGKEEKPDAVLQARDLDEEPQEVPLTESMWDACLLVGSPCLGHSGSAWVVGGLVLNVAIQLIFCALVFSNFMETEFSQGDIDGFRAWRLRIAHDNKYVGGTGLSLANRVCSLDPTLETATEHAARVDMIRRYRQTLDPESAETTDFKKQMSRTFDGPVMCLLALTCWVLTVGKEIASGTRLLQAVLALPAARGAGMHVVKGPDGTEIAGAGRVAKVLAVVTYTVRVTVAVVLLIMGCRYLAYTSSMQDLLLNAVALEVVMNIDELVFGAIAPNRVRQAMAIIAPMKTNFWPKLKPWELKSVGICVLLVGTVLWVRLTVLQEHIDNLKDAHTELCGGLQSFTVVTDRLGMVQFMHGRSFQGDSEFTDLTTIPDLAVNELIHGEAFTGMTASIASATDFLAGPMRNCTEAKCIPQYSLFPAMYSLTLDSVKTPDLQSLTAGIYTTRGGAGCHDALDFVGLGLAGVQTYFPWLSDFWNLYVGQTRTWLHYLNALGGRSTPGQSCTDFRHLCGTKAGEAVTALCPITCGCNSLGHGRMNISTSTGCPRICMGEVNPERKAAASCLDANHSNASDPKWQTLVQWTENMIPAHRDPLLQHGCAGADVYTFCLPPTDFQVDSSPFLRASTPSDPYFWKLITFLCPRTCNCGGTSSGQTMIGEPPDAICPDSCTCRWNVPVKEPPSGSGSCTVPYWSPSGANNFSYAPVQTSHACCALMQEHRRTAQLKHSLTGSEEVRSTLCQSCYLPCLEQLWSMPVLGAPGPWTYPSEFFLLYTGTAEVNYTGAAVLCSGR